jgi:hypothetical protein
MRSNLVQAISKKNLKNPLVRIWAQNDNIDWKPKAPIYAIGILQDLIVPFAGSNYPVPLTYTGGKPFFAKGNAENLIRTMRKNGYGADRVAWCATDAQSVKRSDGQNVTMHHLNALVPVSILAARAIESGSLKGLPFLQDPQ